MSRKGASSDSNKKPTKENQVFTDIQVYDPSETLSSNGFIDVFCRTLEGFKCRPRIAMRRSYQEIDKTMPLLVLCHHQFRIGTDVDAATRDIVAEGTAISLESVAVVVVLEKDAHALPINRSTDQLLDKKYDKFGLIVDIAFGTNKTLYKCSLNEEGFSSLNHFLEKYKQYEIPVKRDKERNVNPQLPPVTAQMAPAPTQIDFKTIVTIPVTRYTRFQVYCELDSERASSLYTGIETELQGASGEVDVVKLKSILDRDIAVPLIAIVEAHSAIHKEFMVSKDVQNGRTVLLILQDGIGRATVEDNTMPTRIYLDKRDGMANFDVSALTKALGSAFKSESEHAPARTLFFKMFPFLDRSSSQVPNDQIAKP